MAFEELAFRHPWRSYQRRVLDELPLQEADGHIHVVAAPGSGKTVLGLELMRRLGKPALVLSPSLAIRNQWIDRLVDLFLPDDVGRPDWISIRGRDPGLATFLTYQAVHAAMNNVPEITEEDEAERDNEDATFTGEPVAVAGPVAPGADFIQGLRELGVTTLVLDEARHLRREWWRALVDMREALGIETVVALTATPPMDVDGAEWRRYIEMCGEIDTEIPIAELVGTEELCPHDDFLYLCEPTERECERLAAFELDLGGLRRDLLADKDFAVALRAIPAIAEPEEDPAWALENPETYTSLLNRPGFTGGSEL